MDSVDRYRFALLGLSPEEARARSSCAARTTSANTKWNKADVTLYDPSVLGSAPSKALKALVRQGIPDDLRPDLWLLFSGGLAKKKAAPPGHYALLLRKAAQCASGAVDAASLGAELSRAFGTHPFLSTSKGVRTVMRILEAHLLHGGADAGVPRGMACIAAFLLAVLGPGREEDAFWTFAGLLENRVPASCVLENTKGAGVEQRVLQALMAKRFPKIVAQLEKADTSVEEVTRSWFSSLFCTALPAETAVRIWDVLFLEGPKILFRTALALFKMNESAILGTKLSVQVARCVSWRIARCYDPEALFKVAFSGIGSLSMAAIKRARADYEGVVLEQMAEHRRRLEDLLSSPKLADGHHASGDSPTSSASEQGSPVHLSTIYEDYEDDEEASHPTTKSFFSTFLRPLQAVKGF
ncbi:hypothetical protein CVIRNUC_006168 [Coccomyxa viridis]|uniref:Rab-GAP TBC domain-containing protein n=1 Tax=Coccomyxa viridis TaxID=1274662 RepID=A0AAV1I6J7_9CHLO|nr:hypothetical protein CVIRNUC_006168 [Coccomyxa viridis]